MKLESLVHVNATEMEISGSEYEKKKIILRKPPF